MTTPFKLTRIASLKTVADFRTHCASVGADLPLEDTIEAGAGTPLSQPIARTKVNGKTLASATAYEVITQVPCVVVAPRLPAILGIDTLAIVISKTTMKFAPAMTTAAAHRRNPLKGAELL